MAKAKKSQKGGASSDGTRPRLIKVTVSDAEVSTIRVAAAIGNVAVSAFVREAALEQAAKIIADRYPGRR